jgi:alcohol dehydrogenase class IV
MNVAHGHTSCVLCPSVMKYNARVNANRQQRALNALWSDSYIRQSLESQGNLRESSADLGDALDAIFREFCMPRTLKEVGVEGDEKLRELARKCLEDPWCRTNPIPLLTEEQVMEILKMVEK